MSARILILGDGTNRYGEDYLLESVRKISSNAIFGHFTDLIFDLSINSAVVEFRGEDICNFDLVWIRNARGFYPESCALAMFLASRGKEFIGEHFLHSPRVSKLEQYMTMAVHRISMPRTVYCADSNSLASFVESAVAFPIIVKPIMGQRSKNNYLCRGISQLEKRLSEHIEQKMVAQEFVNSDEDYRILIFRTEVIKIFRRRRKSDGEKYARLVSIEECSAEALPQIVLQQAKQLAQALNREFTGIDVIIEPKAKRAYFLEANTVPGLYKQSSLDAVNKVLSNLLTV